MQPARPLAITAWMLLACAAAAPVHGQPAAGVADPRPGSVQPVGIFVTGQVIDASGAPVVGAQVRLEIDGAPPVEAETGADGRFRLVRPQSGRGVVRVRAPGFADTTADVPALPADAMLRLVLGPAPLAETVTVTASRGAERLATPSAATVLTAADLLTSAAGTVDDALRATPGFSLFRRASSRVANPTTQGVTLRGLAGSGASRTLVLADGVPLNDPFGSWVYWNRVPVTAIERIEVVRGATGDLYGPDALGGVVQILTLPSSGRQVRAVVEGGSHGTARASGFAGGRRGAWSAAAAGEALRTGGVFVVARDERGSVDARAGSDYGTAFARVGYEGSGWRALARASLYGETRDNGTPLQVNDTRWRQVSGELAGSAGGGAWQVRVSGGTERYHQTFSAVSSDRTTERLTTEQRIPSTFASGDGHWTRSWGARAIAAGGEVRHVTSTVRQTRHSFTGATIVDAPFGGAETSAAAFARASAVVAGRATIVAGARGERWTSDPLETAGAPPRARGFFSPRVSLAWPMGRGVTGHAAAYRAYRTPTLNELNRGFRVGNVVTAANPNLAPERLTGVEGGVLVTRARGSARLTAFWNRLDDAVTNVTVSVSPAIITRERRNADRIRSAGVEVEADFRPHRALRVTALAAVTSARFQAVPASPDLAGNRVPQVPRYQLGAGVTFADPRTLTLAAQARVVGLQFDDDRNELRLEPFAVVDVQASRSIGRGLHLVVAVENLFDVEFDVGRTPVRTIGWPRTVRAGLRLFFP